MPPEQSKPLFQQLRRDLESGRAASMEPPKEEKLSFTPTAKNTPKFIPKQEPVKKAFTHADHVSQALEAKEREADDAKYRVERA